MPNYVSAADLKLMKIDGEIVDLCNFEDNEIEDQIEIVETFIEKITGNIFYVKTETNYFDGGGLTKLYFIPEISYKLLDVTTVKEIDFDASTVLDTLTEDTDFKTYEYYLEMSRSYAGDSPRLRFGSGGVFPKGQKNIEIIGVWGFEAAISGDGTTQINTGTLTTVVGVGTRFVRDFRVNSLIQIGGVNYTVSAIASDTSITLSANFGGTLDSALSYNYFKVPLDIQKATRELSMEALVQGSTTLSSGDADRVKWPDFEIEFTGADEGTVTGFPAIDRILINRINFATMFLVVPDDHTNFTGVS